LWGGRKGKGEGEWGSELTHYLKSDDLRQKGGEYQGWSMPHRDVAQGRGAGERKEKTKLKEDKRERSSESR